MDSYFPPLFNFNKLPKMCKNICFVYLKAQTYSFLIDWLEVFMFCYSYTAIQYYLVGFSFYQTCNFHLSFLLQDS